MFKKGDYITVDGKEGSIVDINFLFTTLMTPDNKKVTLPNSTIVNSSVVNAGANKTRRVDFTFSVAYETDVEKVKEIVISVMKSNGKVYDNEEHTPFCRLKTLGSSSIDFFANCWVDKEDYWDVYYYIIENVYNEFKRNGISIPYNQLEVRSRTDTVVMPYNKQELPQRVEKQRDNAEHFDLETADLVQMLKSRQSKNNSKTKTKKDKTKAEDKTETTAENQTKTAKAKKFSSKKQ
jgi:small-conductance mechanosensitive channel